VKAVSKMTKILKKIERDLLPQGKLFTTEQSQVIGAKGNINIVAGPGSGKTTVLTAKLITLLKKQKDGDKGVCCITHTNVAVEEIKARASLAGVGDIEYPNFVGTIQSFSDHFFGSKAFSLVLPGKKMRIMDGKQYNDLYSQLFRQRVTWWNRENVPGYKRKNAQLVISKDMSFSFKNSAPGSYSADLNDVLRSILSRGIVNSEQMIALANWYVSLHSEKLSRAMEQRFNYLLLDEAQDTNDFQYKLLTDLTKDSSINFQKFGDPYQALYTIFSNETTDAWRPRDEEEQGIAQIKEIATTARFGTEIAELVRDVCYEEYPTFHSNNPQNVFKKFFLTFSNESELRDKYKRLIDKSSAMSNEFQNCELKDSIVAPLHKNLENLFSEYERPTNTSLLHIKTFENLLRLSIRKIASFNGVTAIEEHQYMRENPEWASVLVDIVKMLFLNQASVETLVPLISSILSSEAQGYAKKVSEELLNDAKQFNKISVESRDYKTDHQFYISTIHNIKGETHRSTLLLLDSKVDRQGNVQHGNNPFFKTLLPFLIGNRIDYSNRTDSKLYKDYLKFAYVALSRPKFLDGIAIPTSDITKEERDKLLKFGWVEAL